MPFYASKLTDVLCEHLPDWHGARLKFISRYIGSLLKLTTTNGKKLALALKATVKTESNYRRIQRFMADYSFDFEVFGRFLLSLLPQKSGFVVVMDRTEWHFGQTPVNVLMIGFAYKGIAFPVLWQVLRKEGSSSTEERKTLFERALPAARRAAADPRVRGGPGIHQRRLARLSGRPERSVCHSYPLEAARGARRG